MKLAITILWIFLISSAFSQTGKVKLDITITDTSKPFFLDIYTRKGKDLVSKLTVITSGSYFINDLKEGYYNLEFHSFESGKRRVHIDSVNVKNNLITNRIITYPEYCRFFYPKDYKPICPYNHSDSIVIIMYGFPSNKEMEKAKKGLIHLGGCIVTDCDPMYYCTIHKKEI